MKLMLLVLFAVVCIASISAEKTDEEWDKEYEEWKVKFNRRTKPTPESEARRKGRWIKARKLVEEHNAKKDKTFEVALNEHVAKNETEKSELKGLKHPELITIKSKRSLGGVKYGYRKNGATFQIYTKSATAPVRTANDLRTIYKNPVVNQGQCGSCWTFASTAVIDAAFAIKKGQTIQTSQQEFVDCGQAFTINSGCNGGSPGNAFEYVFNRGITLVSTYKTPYTGVQASTCQRPPNAQNVTIAGWFQVDKDEEALRQALDEYGALAIAMEVSTDPAFMAYKSGIYRSTVCLNADGTGDHAMTLVGYGVDTATNLPFWIIRNSWGTTWGEAGHMRLLRNANTCGIKNSAFGVFL